MGDYGKLYPGFTREFAGSMARLCGKADIIVPNMTEASYMLGTEYIEEYDEAYVRELLKRLCALGAGKAVLTGVSFENGRIGVMSYDSKADEYFSYFREKIYTIYHGTGDV